MIFDEELKSKLKGKHILVDTNVLDALRLHSANPNSQNFLSTLENLRCFLTMHDLVKAEYLRDANKQTELETRRQILETLCKNFSLSLTGKMYFDAMILSWVYVRHQNKGIELVDLMSSIFLKTYAPSNTLVLVTKNHHDFPLCVHDRLGTVVLDHGKELSTLAFYTFNLAKWEKEISALSKSSEWNS